MNGFVLDLNLSIQQLTGDFPQKVIGVLNEHSFLPNMVNFGIRQTNNLALKGYQQSIAKQLHDSGVSFSLDGLGAAFSQLDNIETAPVDVIKIEPEIKNNITTNFSAKSIIELTIQKAHQDGIKVVAQGIEKEETLEYILNSGADYLQGYIVAKPQPAAQLERQLYKFLIPHKLQKEQTK